MIGTYPGLKVERLSALIRTEGIALEDLNEVRLPTRFLYILLGAISEQTELEEIGRAMSTIMNDEVHPN